ncbi:TRAP transporter substrate-binding protein [Sulfurospirillum arcachonense]|uniref:TRAP transporter substrate-binding protein n=1 Tax=Sulfurospirillum arcachonense TaxID=57666 RepID=UPI00046AEAEF|nr:TRAP transporter substrate-binding protein [Sulfurospirillum arcachonense]
MNKFVKIIAATAVLASATFAADYTIKFSHVVSANTPKGKAADYFAKRVKELTEGRVEVKVFPSSQLYTDKAVMKALKIGNVQMAAPSFSKFTSLVPQLQIFDLPFLFKDVNHVHAAMDGEVGKAMKDLVTKKGFVALSYWDNGFKHLSSNKKALIEPKDAAGQKFRIMSSKVIEAQFLAVKANPQVLPFSEVYSALQQGVVDAAENPLSNFYTKKFYEVQTDLTLSSHGYLGYLVVMSKKFWKKLPADLKPKIMQAMDEATAMNRKLAAELEASYLAKIKAYADKTGKLKIHTLSDAQKEAWRKVTAVVYPDFYKVIGEDLIKKAQE